MGHEEATVGDIMQKKVETVTLNTRVRDCAKAMVKRKISCAVVVEGSTALGIVTERDLVTKVMGEDIDPAKVLVRDIMSTPLVTINPEASIEDASKLMSEYRIRRLVVIDGSGMLAGIVTAGDIARSLAKQHNYEDVSINAIARIRASPGGGPYQ